MGLLLSRVRNDPYYASYEKRLEKLEAECCKLQAQTQHIQRISSSITGYYLLVAAMLTIFAASHAAWVHQQPAGTFEWDEHLARTSPVVVLPLVLWLGHELLLRFFRWKKTLREARLKKLMEKKRKMIKEVKDMTRYEKVSEFLKKWDPDFAPPAPLAPLPTTLTSGSMAIQANRTNSTPELLYRLTGGAASAAVGAAAEAGKSLLPLLDKVAQNVVGDSPMLVHDIRRLQHQVQSAEARARQLAMENSVLKQQCASMFERLKELDPAVSDLSLPGPYLIDAAHSSAGAHSAGSAGAHSAGSRKEEEATSSSKIQTSRGEESTDTDGTEAGTSQSRVPAKEPSKNGVRVGTDDLLDEGSSSSRAVDGSASSTRQQLQEEERETMGALRTCAHDARRGSAADAVDSGTTAT